MANFLLFNGAMNNTVFGLQVYFWIILAMFIITVTTYAVWWFFFWMPLTPLHGHFKAHISKINSAFVFDEHLNFDLRSEKRAKLIFDETVKEAKEAQRDWHVAPSGLIGKVLTDLIFDGGRWTDLTSPERDEIERIADLWNETNPSDEIHTLMKFRRYLEQGKFAAMGVKEIVQPTYNVSWLRIDKAIPKDHIQPMWDGYLRQLSERMNKDDSGNMSIYAYLVLGISALICIGMLAIKFLK